MEGKFRYCEKCDDETYHVGNECRRCVNRNKVIINIPMHILHEMVNEMVNENGAYKMPIDEAIDRTVDTVRGEIKAMYNTWKEENEKRGW